MPDNRVTHCDGRMLIFLLAILKYLNEIEKNICGNELKKYILSLGIVKVNIRLKIPYVCRNMEKKTMLFKLSTGIACRIVLAQIAFPIYYFYICLYINHGKSV